MKGKLTTICTSCFLFLVLIACEKSQDDFINRRVHDLLIIQKPINSVPADGKSTVKVKAHFTELVDKKTITFSCSNCKFANDSDITMVTAIRTQDKLEAEVAIKPTLEAKRDILITCFAQDFNDSTFFHFDTAFAEKCIIEADQDTIKRLYSSTLNVSVFLNRNIGTPSLGQKVKFSAEKPNTEPIGSFRSISLNGSDSTGKVSATFELRDTSYLGPIHLIADLIGPNSPRPDTFVALVRK